MEKSLNMNYKEVFNTMVDETAQYLIDNNLNTMVLGISGGIDSTLTAAICSEVENRYPKKKFYGVSLPCSSNTNDENNSALSCLKAFCKPDQYWVENLQKEFRLMRDTCYQNGPISSIGAGNIKARLRMIYLYDIAQKTRGIVMDTDNLTEHYLGFFTIHGDVADFNPIGGLWKHEVYELTNWLKDHYDEFVHYISPDSFDSKDEIETRNYYARKVEALSYALGITPTDGNGVNDLGDMGQIAPNFAHDSNYEAYTKVDDIILTFLEKIKPFWSEISSNKTQKLREGACEAYKILQELNEKYDPDTVGGVIRRHLNTEFKRHPMPLAIPRDKYDF